MARFRPIPSTPVTQYDVDRVLAGLRRGDQSVSHEIVARMWTEILQRRGNQPVTAPIVRGADGRHDSPAFNSFAELAIDLLKGVK